MSLGALGPLVLRTLSKPIAARVRHHASIHPKFRESIIGLAQANHRLATNMQRRLHGRELDIHIRPLNEDRAIRSAADLLGELFLFSAGCGAIIYEVQRSAKSETRKEETREQELEAIKKRLDELQMENQIMAKKASELRPCAANRVSSRACGHSATQNCLGAMASWQRSVVKFLLCLQVSEIRNCSKGLNLLTIHVETILYTTLHYEMGLQSLMSSASLSLV